jgi:hypothetical protein
MYQLDSINCSDKDGPTIITRLSRFYHDCLGFHNSYYMVDLKFNRITGAYDIYVTGNGKLGRDTGYCQTESGGGVLDG